jgi:hypothetical protein
MVEIRKCTCRHADQDRRYGPGMRVHNSFGKDKKHGWRCTVCGKETEVSQAVSKAAKDV